DGIRDGHVTGVQTCALPILWALRRARLTTSKFGFPSLTSFAKFLPALIAKPFRRGGAEFDRNARVARVISCTPWCGQAPSLSRSGCARNHSSNHRTERL